MNFQDRVVLVTGGSKGIGRGICLAFAARGARVVVNYAHDEEAARRVEEEVRREGGHPLLLRADIAAREDVDRMFREILDRFGRLDVLVNNASLYQPSSLATFTTAQSRAMWAIHVEAPMLLCRRFERYLRTVRGHVINMVDLLAERPWPEYLVYCASKAGLLNLTLGLARELAPDVTVNGISPGVVAWPNDYSEQERQRYLNRVPLGREGTPEDVASAVAFLVSGGSYITGQILRLDGGRSIT